MQVQQTIPMLRIFNVDKALQFYRDFLGFTVDWEHRFEADLPLYMQISRGGCMLHLTEHHGDCCPGSGVFVWMTGLEAFYHEINAKGYNYLRPSLEKTSYGSGDALCMTVTDPFCNRIRFNERLGTTEAA